VRLRRKCCSTFCHIRMRKACPSLTRTSPTRSGVSPHILVVDDQREICDVLKEGLETAPDYYVSCSTRGTDAIAIIKEHQPDFAVIDLLLPDAPGADVARAALEQNMPVLFITGDPDTALQLLNSGVPHILKPFRLNELLDGVGTELKATADNLRRVREY